MLKNAGFTSTVQQRACWKNAHDRRDIEARFHIDINSLTSLGGSTFAESYIALVVQSQPRYLGVPME